MFLAIEVKDGSGFLTSRRCAIKTGIVEVDSAVLSRRLWVLEVIRSTSLRPQIVAGRSVTGIMVLGLLVPAS